MPDFGFDDWIDAQLRNVPLPPDLLSRLAANRPAESVDQTDAKVDALLRNVPVPAHLALRLRRIPRSRAGSPLWFRVGLAAGVFLMLGMATAGYLALLTRDMGLDKPLATRQAPAGADLVAQPSEEARASGHKTAARRASRLEASKEIASNAARSPDKRAAGKVPADSTSSRPAAAAPLTADSRQSPASTSGGQLPFTVQDVVAVSSSFKQTVEERLRTQAALGARGQLERLPPLEVLEVSAPGGITSPRVRGYDLLFELKHGEHPFASPAAHEALASARMPFTFRTASFDLAAAGARRGRLPPAEEIRIEDFLAAQSYGLAAPAGGLALHVVTGPSPFGDSGPHLLQLVVKAGPSKAVRRRPTRLVVVVDISAPMARAARFETAQRALSQLAAFMLPADRITLIGYAEQPRVLAENASGKDLAVLLASGTLPEPAGSADFAAAIRTACQAVTADASNESRSVIFVTAGRDEFDLAAMNKSSEALVQLASAKVPWQIARLAANHPDAQLVDWAQQAQGVVTASPSAAELYAALVEKLTGRSSLVASGATLKVTFNPKVVTGYRLLGHTSATLTGEAPDPLEIDLNENQTATGLYELWIKPSGGDNVALAELAWRDPTSGQGRQAKSAIRRGMMAPSFSQAPAWFQKGVIAAKTAEILRGSSFAPSGHPLGQLRDAAEQVDPRAAREPDFQALLRLMEQAQKLR